MCGRQDVVFSADAVQDLLCCVFVIHSALLLCLSLIHIYGEYQVVIGQDVPDLYEEVVKIDGIQAGGSVQDDEAAAKDLAQDHGCLLYTSRCV